MRMRATWRRPSSITCERRTKARDLSRAGCKKDNTGPVILAYHKSFGLGCAFTYEELYDFIDKTIFKQTTTQNYPNAYLYIVKNGTPTATRRFLEKRNLPTNLDVMARPGFFAPDDTTIAQRVTSSLTSLNWTEVKSIDWGGFEKKSK